MNHSFFTGFIFIAIAINTINAQLLNSDKRVEFSIWKSKQGKEYGDKAQESLRMELWSNMDIRIQQHNQRYAAGKETYLRGHNKFSDMTTEEKQIFLGAVSKDGNGRFLMNNMIKQKKTTKSTTKKTTTKKTTTTKKPTTTSIKSTTKQISTTTPQSINSTAVIDWRTVPGVLQPIKNQGNCGSCWAFAAVSALESAIFLKTGQSLDLSEQQLVDCTYRSTGHDGCQGGWMSSAYNYLISSIGSDKTGSYPYVSGSSGTWGSSCKTNTLGTSAVGYTPVKSYVQSPDGSVSWLENAVAKGPVSVAFIVVNSFFSYSSGVYYDADCTWNSPNMAGGHAVVVVGYGTDPKDGDYWIVRNSWGTSWGDKGYILMARNRGNLCELESWGPTYPVV